MENPRVITVCAAVVFSNEKVLIIQEAKKYEFKKYNFPGGRIELGEDPKSAVIREVKEETNIDIELSGFIGIYPHIASNGSTIVKLLFSATPKTLKIDFPLDEIFSASWMNISDFLETDKKLLRSNDLISILEDYRRNRIHDVGIVKGFC